MSTEDATVDERSETKRVLHLVRLLLLLAAALGALVLALQPERSTDFLVPWWGLAIFFAMTESAVFHVQIKREAQTVSISELPLVIGLFLALPEDLVLGRLVGSLAVFAIYRRSSLLKTTFNTVLVLTETLVALVVFQTLAGGTVTGVDPVEWVAALGAVLVANALGSIAIGLVIAVYEGGLVWSELLKEAVTGQVFAPGVVVLALMTIVSLAHDPRSGWLVAGSAVTLVLCYRMYASLFDRHVNLEKLYHFSQAVTDSPENESVEKRVLTEAMDLLQSGHASLLLIPSRESGTPVRISMDAEGRAERVLEAPVETTDWLQGKVVGEGTATLLPRRSRERKVKQWLARQGLRDALAVPLRGHEGVIGMLLVGDRLGEVRTYDNDDVILLETLANHASVALQKGELIEQLQHEALHDALTGLPNRAQLQRELSVALQRSLRSSTPLAVMIMDLDGFKDVNDTLGHQQGDQVLVEVAERLTRAVGHDGLVARLGGDEFAVLVPRLAGREHAAAISSRLVHSLEAPMELQGMTFEVGGSVGVAVCPEHGVEAGVLMKRADLAMYEAKSTTSKVRFYSSADSGTSVQRLALAAELRTALTNGDLQVYMQPQLDLASGEVRGMEALARWRHPTRGFVSPDEFIPIAERSGLIKPLTLAVLDRALEAVSACHGHDVAVSVNLSPRSLLDQDLVESVRDALSRRGVPAECLTLEVTEGAVMTDPARAVALLTRLRGLGVKLSIDDFGTGYSSLSYLTQLPVDEVKIDKSFVTSLTSSRDDLAIVRSIIGLGTTLGLDVVAEGVEDKATQDLLHALDCTRIQGWHVAKPMPVGDIASWLEQHHAAVGTADAGAVGRRLAG